MTTASRHQPFRVYLLASLAVHLAAAGLLRAGVTISARLDDEMVIDLTGSFRTRPPARTRPRPADSWVPADTPAALPDPGPAALAVPDAAAAADGDPDDGDPTAPLHEITKLPELKDRGALREKLERYYPAAAKARGVEGVVSLEVTVSSKGRITAARVVRADPPEFADAAVAVTRELEFIPAYLGSRPVAVRIRLPVRFEIER